MHVFKTAITLIALCSINNLYAATYYVKPSGSDNANGRSHAAAWKSVKKVKNYNFKAGDDVYFLSGGKWRDQLVVRWSGTSSNRVVIGSYYMANGAEKIGVKSGAAKPILIGNYPQYNSSKAIPRSKYGSLLQVNANYVTVQNMRIENSSANGMTLSKGFHHAIFENNEIDGTAESSMLFLRKTHSNIMRKNEMKKCALRRRDKYATKWPVCNGAIGSRKNLIEKNLVTESYGEGIVAFDVGADNNIIRNNRLAVIRTIGIYVDNGSNNIVERNIVVGEVNNKGKGDKGSAFALSVEDYPNNKDATGNIFRNNLAANTSLCMWIGMEKSARDKGFKVGGNFIGNTCVGMKNSIIGTIPSKNYEKLTVSNNIFHDMDTNGCAFPGTSKINLEYNLWQVKQKNTNCQGNGDVIGNPKLIKTNWDNAGANNLPSANQFKPRSGSVVYRQGISHPDLRKDFYNRNRSAIPTISAIE